MSAPKFQIPQLGNRPSNVQKEFKRAYMACIHCRRTKVKCEISEDSNGCEKCRRERRACVFTAERSTKRRRTGDDRAEDSQFTAQGTEFTSRARISSSAQDGEQTHAVSVCSSDPKRQKGGSANRTRSAPVEDQTTDSIQIYRTGPGSATVIGGPAESNYDSEVINTVVSSSKDALGLLFKAAEQQDTDDAEEQDMVSAARNSVIPGSALTGCASAPPVVQSDLSKPLKSVIDVWNQHRFVKQGWFSSVEAITYIDLFFRNLASLSPISSFYYANHNHHKSLIIEEPLLCCTLLMISSRHHVLPGPGGASRAEIIHMRLWKHCEHLIQRITFGQEKYSAAKTRTLGSIKALLLMTEWHPKALHFPPEQDGWDASLAPGMDNDHCMQDHDTNAHLVRWKEEVFEPAKRSDRMSWMLLGLATTLAHELGVFEDPDPEDDPNDAVTPISRTRVRRLLFLYVNQLSLRLGCTSFLPQTYSMSLTPPQDDLEDIATRERDMMISLWIDITKLRKTTTEMFFPTKFATRQIMQSGTYVSLLEHFHPLLAKWHKDFTELKTTTISTPSKLMLLIDYSYVRMYINSIAIQALVERAKSRGTPTQLDYEFLKNDSRQDYKFIQEVIDASRNVLSIAVELAEADVLRYCPVRVFLHVISASIFLLKAISLGTTNSDLRKSLEILDRCIHVLRYSTHDDMHLSSKYGMLIDRHVRRFKRNFRVQSGSTASAHAQPSNIEEIATSPPDAPPFDPWQSNHGMAQNQSNSNPSISATLPNELTWEIDDWLTQPFDASFAPFGTGINQGASGIETNSLDFLWNLPT